MNVVFFGSSDYCLPILAALQSHFNLAGVITRPDRSVGRKKAKTASAPKLFAKKNHLACFTPENKDELLLLKNKLTKLEPEIAVVADFGLIIPKEIFTLPKRRTLNLHFSKLPKYRGASPVQYTLLMGEKSAWISVIIMDETLDTGDIIWKKEYKLSGAETTGVLYEKLFAETARELPAILNNYALGKLIPQKQDHTQATYTRHLTRADGFIPWEILKGAINNTALTSQQLSSWPLSQIIPSLKIARLPARQENLKLKITHAYHAFTPWPGLWTTVNLPSPKRLKLRQLHLVDDKLVLEKVQLEGKNPVSWQQFTQAYRLTL